MWHAQTHAYNVEGSGKAKWQEESHCLMSHCTHAQMHFGGVPATASWQSPLTRRHSSNLSESRFRAVQCYDYRTKRCGSRHDTQ